MNTKPVKFDTLENLPPMEGDLTFVYGTQGRLLVTALNCHSLATWKGDEQLVFAFENGVAFTGEGVEQFNQFRIWNSVYVEAESIDAGMDL